MKKPFTLILLALLTSGCYKQLLMEGFEKEKWKDYFTNCSTYRLDIADHVVNNQTVLLEGTQNEVESLLGRPDEHELYERNQKYFHYRLNPPDSCGSYAALSYLSIRFNAIGRANLVQVMLREPNTK